MAIYGICPMRDALHLCHNVNYSQPAFMVTPFWKERHQTPPPKKKQTKQTKKQKQTQFKQQHFRYK